MQTNSDKDFQDLRDKVNRVDQRQEETVIPALKEIKDTLSEMAFLSLSEYNKDKEEFNKWKKKVEDFITNATPAIKFFNIFNSRWTQILAGGLILAALYAVFGQLNKIGLF